MSMKKSNNLPLLVANYFAKRSWVLFPMGSLGFFIDLILLGALWPWGQVSL